MIRYINRIAMTFSMVGQLAFAQETFNFETISHNLISANIYDIKIRDGYAYCADEYGLSIWSIDDPDLPELFSRCPTPGNAMKVALGEGYAYVADVRVGVAIIDISDVRQPRYVTNFDVIHDFPGAPVNISAHDSLLLVSRGNDGLLIASLETPEDPEILLQGEHNERGNYTDLLMKDNYLFVNDRGNRSVLIMDFADWNAPELVSEIPGALADIDIQDNTLAMLGADSLLLYDILNPVDPERLGSYRASRFDDVKFTRNLAIIGQAGVLLLDISNRNHIRLLDGNGQHNDKAYCIEGDRIYAAQGDGGMLITSIVNQRELEITGNVIDRRKTGCVLIDNDIAIILDYNDGVRTLNITDQESPEIIDWLNLNLNDGLSSGADILLEDDILYVKVQDTLSIVGIDDDSNLRLLSQMTLMADGTAFELISHYLIVSGRIWRNEDRIIDGNLVVIDIEDPENPNSVFTARDNESGPRTGVRLGDLFFQMSDIEGGGGLVREVLVYSLDDPSQPHLLGSWPEDEYKLLIPYERMIYCYYDNGDFVTLSIENPLEPEIIDVVQFDPEYNFVPFIYTVDENILYLGSALDGIMAISLLDPTNPQLVGYLDTPGKPGDLGVSNNCLYVADGNNFGIYRFTGDIGEGGNENLYRIAIEPGWNFISAPIRPNIRNIVSIFNPIAGSLVMAKDYHGNFYLPARQFNNIPFWNHLQGYQVKLSGRASLPIEGDPVAADTPIEINQGWYLAPYYPDLPQEPEVAFANIQDRLRLAKDDRGDFYLPAQNFSNMRLLRQGNAYQVFVSENVDFVWNVDQERDAAAEVNPPDLWHFPTPKPTCASMSLLINDLNSYSEVGTFSEGGFLVGAGCSNINGQCGVAVWGDDPTTERVDGAVDGEALTFRVWDGENEQIVQITWYGQAEAPILPKYETDGFATGVIENSTPQNPNEFVLYEPFPNPFNSMVTITFSTGMDARPTRLGVYDLQGRMVADLTSAVTALPVAVEGSSVTRGGVRAERKVVWDAGSVGAGVFFVRLLVDEKSQIKRILLIR